MGLGRPILIVQDTSIEVGKPARDLLRDLQLLASDDDLTKAAAIESPTFRSGCHVLQRDKWKEQSLYAGLRNELQQGR
jgi:hypothetical protein